LVFLNKAGTAHADYFSTADMTTNPVIINLRHSKKLVHLIRFEAFRFDYKMALLLEPLK
jgi:hypothetical protein